MAPQESGLRPTCDFPPPPQPEIEASEAQSGGTKHEGTELKERTGSKEVRRTLFLALDQELARLTDRVQKDVRQDLQDFLRECSQQKDVGEEVAPKPSCIAFVPPSLDLLKPPPPLSSPRRLDLIEPPPEKKPPSPQNAAMRARQAAMRAAKEETDKAISIPIVNEGGEALQEKQEEEPTTPTIPEGKKNSKKKARRCVTDLFDEESEDEELFARPMKGFMAAEFMRPVELTPMGTERRSMVAASVPLDLGMPASLGSRVSRAWSARKSCVPAQEKESEKDTTASPRDDEHDDHHRDLGSYSMMNEFKPGKIQNLYSSGTSTSRFHKVLETIVFADSFNLFIGLLIGINALWIGLQTEMDVRAQLYGSDMPAFLRIGSSCFCIVFTLEIVLRITVNGRTFFISDDWKWNMFDLVIVAMQLSEEILELAFSGGGMSWSSGSSWMRILRVLRLVRIMRLVRILRLLRELRTMLSSICATMGSLGWTMVLLLLVTYAASICIAQLISDHASHSPQDVVVGSPLQVYYGSLGGCMLALYQGITGGVDWRDLSDPLDAKLGWAMSFLFAMFVAFTTLSLLNIVTGIFVESALQNTKEEASVHMINRLREVIRLTNLPADGRITWDEFSDHLDTPQMMTIFKSVDLDVSEAKALFKLLDVGDTGAIHAEDFIMGCLRLRGEAKAIDLATLMSETRRMHRQWRLHTSDLKSRIKSLAASIESLPGIARPQNSDFCASMALGTALGGDDVGAAFFATQTEKTKPKAHAASEGLRKFHTMFGRGKTGDWASLAKDKASEEHDDSPEPLSPHSPVSEEPSSWARSESATHLN